MLAIFKKELKAYYCSMFSYVYYMIFFLVAGILFSKNCVSVYSTEFGYNVLQYLILVVVIMLPFCTMRIFSQDKKMKTDQLLFTAPVSAAGVLLGKALATFLYVMLPVVLSLLYPLFLTFHGTVNGDFLFCSYLGGALFVLALLCISMFISSLTSNGILSAVLIYVFYIIVLLGDALEDLISVPSVYHFLHSASIYNRYFDMISGIVRTGDIIYFIVLIIVFYGCTWISLLSRRQEIKKTVIGYVVATVIFAVLITIGESTSKVFDFTPEKILELSKDTISNVSSISNETVIYYLGAESNANATYVELLKAYEELSDKISVMYVPLDDRDFKATFLAGESDVKEASIVVASAQRYIYLNSDNYITLEQTSSYGFSHMLEIEDQITSAILYVNTKNINMIAKTTGHGENQIGYSFMNLLNLAHYDLKSIDLEEESKEFNSSTMDDVKAIFIYSPETDFSENEIEYLKNYVKDGGKIVVSIDPLHEDLENLNGFLEFYGFNVQSGIVIEGNEACYVLDTPYYLAPIIKKSDYTESVGKKNLRVLTYTSKGIAQYGVANGYESTDILLSSEQSFAKTDDFDNMEKMGQYDKKGPFSIASISSKQGEGSVFLIASDTMFTDEANEESGNANARFFSEMMKSFVGTKDTVWIAGKDVNTQVAKFSEKTILPIKLVTIVVIPAFIVLICILVLVGRKKNLLLVRQEKRYQKQLIKVSTINDKSEIEIDQVHEEGTENKNEE